MPTNVLSQELEQLCSGPLVQLSVRELGKTLAEDDLLALKADIFGPLHKAAKISLRLVRILALRITKAHALSQDALEGRERRAHLLR